MQAKQAFVPKSRKPKFELSLWISDLNNVPLIAGTAYVKWHLPSSSTAEHKGHTSKALIRDHKAIYDYHKVVPVRLTVDKNGILQECDVYFEILQDYSESGRGGGVTLGTVKFNLAEYVDDGQGRRRTIVPGQESGDDDGIVRRYLMQESKINSTLKVGIKMRLVEGDTNFTAPSLKTATVFGGIAGVLATEPGETLDENGSHLPNLSSTPQEHIETQDMYRRTLAASWTCHADQLPPDKLIEDLFHGGDGGAMKPPLVTAKTRFGGSPSRQEGQRSEDDSGGHSPTKSESGSTRTIKNRFLTPDAARTAPEPVKNEPRSVPWRSNRGGHSSTDGTGGATSSTPSISGRQSIEQQMRHADKDLKKGDGSRRFREWSEFELREDLRSWQIKQKL